MFDKADIKRDEALGLGETKPGRPLMGSSGQAWAPQAAQGIAQGMKVGGESLGRFFDRESVEQDAHRTATRLQRLQDVLQVLRRPMSDITAEEYLITTKQLRQLGYDV